MTGPFQLRPQSDIEARLLDLIEQLPAVDHTNPERVSWHVGQIAALLFALGAEPWQAVDAAYRLWVGRNENSSQEDG